MYTETKQNLICFLTCVCANFSFEAFALNLLSDLWFPLFFFIITWPETWLRRLLMLLHICSVCVCVYSNVLISTKWQHPPFVRAFRVVRIPGLTYFRSVFLSGAVLVGGVGHTWALRDPEQQLPSPSEFVFGYYSPRANAANFCSSMPYAAEFSSCICSLWVTCWIWVSRFALIAFSHPEALLAGRQCFSAPSKSVTYDRYSVVSYACFWKAICYKLRSVRASGLQACCGV